MFGLLQAGILRRPYPKKNIVYGWDPMPEMTINSPFVHSRVDPNTFTMGNPMPESTITPMPESTLSLFQSWLYPPVRDYEFGLCTLFASGWWKPPVSVPTLYIDFLDRRFSHTGWLSEGEPAERNNCGKASLIPSLSGRHYSSLSVHPPHTNITRSYAQLSINRFVRSKLTND